ncbi:MAG TPA: GNAT family N-acetyltransferase [Burkholderiales bacterium]|nr:GNAT family N-acetyltransferase [Burkholderiales bacterium]
MAVNPSFRIERARADDIPALIDLLAALFAIESDFSPDRSAQRRGLELLLSLPDDRATILVARAQDERVIGLASAQLVISTAEGAASAWIEDVVVQESFRGKGIARQLLVGLEAWSRRHGATRLQLLADAGNAPALDFYRHLGWQATQLGAWRKLLR